MNAAMERGIALREPDPAVALLIEWIRRCGIHNGPTGSRIVGYTAVTPFLRGEERHAGYHSKRPFRNIYNFAIK